MKKVVLGMVLLLLAGVVGAAVYVTNIDWNQHKDKIAEQFYNSTGKRISFDGKLSFRVFPSPYLNAADAKVYNSEDKSQKPLLEIKNVVAELALMPLLKGEFHVKKMTLDEAIINIDWNDKGLSWQSDLSPDQRQMMENTNMILNSVALKNAELNFEDSASGWGFRLDNLNGEIFAESIFGPFRIEGNYIKGNSPEGFALSIGKLSESLATTLNAVVTHPLSESYVRFDGSFHLLNKVLNGNVIVESQKISDFVNANVKDWAVPAEYSKPIALGFDMALNQQKINLSNIVIKYGDTQGAGVLEVVPNDKTGVPEINSSFNFTDLTLDPVIDLLSEQLEKYKEEEFNPQYDIDLFTSIKAVRASYRGQGLKELEADVSVYDDMIDVENFAIVLPGNTNLKLKGNLYPYEEKLYYQADAEASSNDFAQTLEWIGLNPRTNVSAVYKKLLATAKLAGNLDKLQISPYKVTMDKTTLSGEVGIVLADRKDIMLMVDADTINLDNYISQMPEEEKQKSWAERMVYRFKKLGMLNDIDVVLDAKADLLIYENVPFERVDFRGNVLDGQMEIESAKIEKMANTDLELKGKIKGFGSEPEAEELAYKINSTDVASLINKLELDVPDWNYKKFNNLSTEGVVNGKFDSLGINTQFVLGDLTGAYQGTVVKEGGKVNYNGSLEMKYPDFASLAENLRIKYQPAVKSLGLFRISSQISGNRDNLDLQGLDANIGYTAINGNLNYSNGAERPKVTGQLEVSKLELEKFLPKANSSLISAQLQDDAADFWAKPFWSRDKIDYSPYLAVDVEGELAVKELSYKNYLLKDAKIKLKEDKGSLQVSELSGLYNEAPLEATLSLYMRENPTVSLGMKIKDAKVDNFGIGGKVYNLKGGNFEATIDLNSKADSEQSFIENLEAQGEFRVKETELGGMDLKTIYDGLLKREQTAGLAESVKKNIGAGKTSSNILESKFDIKGGKFNLRDGLMTNDYADVAISGSGDLSEWSMNVIFDTKYREQKYLPGFSFALKNNMENPLIDVDVSSLFSFYQNKEQQKKEVLQAEVEAKQAYLAGLAQEQRKLADKLVANARETLEKDIDEKMATASMVESVNKYNVLKQEIAKALAELVEVMNGVVNREVDNTDIQQLKEANAKAIKEIEIFGQRRDDIYLGELKKANATLAQKITEADNQLKQVIFNYNAKVEQYKERIARIITDYSLDDDAQLQNLRSGVERIIANTEAAGDHSAEVKNLIKSEASIGEYETANAALGKILEEAQAEVTALGEQVDVLINYADSVVEDKEKAYAEELKRQEDQKRVEENTGTISIKKTGKILTVTRDIEEIKNIEEEINNDKVKVLDFSKEKETPAEKPELPSANVIKKGRNIIIN